MTAWYKGARFTLYHVIGYNPRDVLNSSSTLSGYCYTVALRWHTVANLHPPEATIQRHDNDMTTSQHNNTTTTTQFF